MPFISPMLAQAEPKKEWDPLGYYIEEKYDGHRLILEVGPSGVKGWSRYGLERKLPDHFQDIVDLVDYGTYDGELMVPGQKSHNVVELEKSKDLVFVAFDVLQDGDLSLLEFSWLLRRQILEELVFRLDGPIRLSHPVQCLNKQQVLNIYNEIVDAGGEGLILKNPDGEYFPGKRPKNQWIKMKTVRTAVLEIIGFAPGRNGPFSKAVLEGDDLKRTTVKVLNDALLAEVHQNPQKFIGKRLRIEYTERYEGGKYRHPRWDHLVEE